MPFRLNASPLLILLAAALFVPLSAVLFVPRCLRAQNPPRTYPVHGVVLNSITHQPIARALVEEGSTAMLTDEQGHFELDLPEGQQQMTVRRPGFRRISEGHAIFVGPNMPDLDFELTPQITVSGQVALSTGEPADAIHVRAYRKSVVDNNREKWLVVQNIGTNASGAFHVPAMERGGSYVFCSEPALEDASAQIAGNKSAPAARFGYQAICYPGPLPVLSGLASEHNAANTLPLTAGQHTEIELALTREPFYHVMVPVLNAARWPNVEVQIHSASERDFDFPTEWSPKLGYAEAYLPNGQYYAEAIARGETSAYGRVDFRVANKPLLAPYATLLPLRPIPVEIHKDFTAPPPQNQSSGIISRLSGRDDPGVGLALVSADESTGDGNMGSGLTKQRGNSDSTEYQLGSASPGRYWVESYPSEGYVSSITSGGVDLTRQPIVIGPGNATAPILINLRNDVGRIQITIQNGTGPASDSESASSEPPQAGVAPGSSTPGEMHTFFVYAFPLTRILWQTPQTAGQGSAYPVTIDGLAPGQYCVVAFDHPQEFNLNDPEAIGRIASLGQTVTVTADGTANVQLSVHQSTEDEPQNFGVVN